MQPDTSSFKRKIATQNQKKSREKTKSHEEAETPQEKWAATAVAAITTRGGHHGQAVVLTGWGSLDFPIRCVLCVALHHGTCLGSFILGLLGLFLKLS